jgi:predicted Zn-dependent protease with MMP-like domain
MCEADETAYREEVRVTLLHEFGHFLGWDEADLFDRGLE